MTRPASKPEPGPAGPAPNRTGAGKPTPYRTELTPEGEQTVIPGCERDAAPDAKQLDLF